MRIGLSFIVLLSFVSLFSQEKLTEKEHEKFFKAETVLRELTETFNNDTLKFEERVQNIHDFIPRFIGILKEKNSFYYNFDSLQTIQTINAPDNTFRIFTWQLKEPLATHKYYGAIQMNTDDLQLIPLFDYSDTMTVRPQGQLTHDNWYGAMYYKCLMTEEKGKKTYTLLGYDESDFISNRKIMETISFTDEEKPLFGHNQIAYYDSLNREIDRVDRLFVEYNDESTVKLNYDVEEEIVIFDHVIPPTDKQEGAQFTYLPDGSYEGFEWKNGEWKWIEKIFHYSINHPDNPPGDGAIFGDKKVNPIFGN